MSATNLSTVELNRYRGDSASLSIALTDPDTGSSFNPVGCVLICTIKGAATDLDAAALVQKISNVGGITVANPCVVSLVPADHAALPARVTFEFDIQAQNTTSGTVKTVARGTLFFYDDVTKGLALAIETTVVEPSSEYLNAEQLIAAKDAAVAAATSAEEDATATAADRVQTGLDRVATGEDATATAADRVQTGLDRVATDADATATAADRVQTGLDKTATAADRVQTGLDRVQTAADRVQTGLDRTAAAASATSAANAVAGQFISVIAGGSVPATASAAGRYYIISSDGTSQGTDWKFGDWAIYNGTSGSWSRLAVGASIDSRTGSRTGADYLKSPGDGTRYIELLLGAAGNVAGSDFSVARQRFTVPTSNPSARATLWAITSSDASDPAGVAWSLGIYLETNGDLTVLQNGATPATDFRKVTYSGWRSTYSGRTVHLLPAFSGASTTAPTLYQDGVALTGGTETDGSGTDPNWVSASLVATYLIQGYLWPAGYFVPGAPINRKYAQTDVDFVQLTGRLPYADAAGGSMVAAYSSNFSAGSDSWAAGGGCTVDGNIDSINGQDDWLRIQRTSTTGQLAIERSLASALSGRNIVGSRVITLKVRVYNASATTRYFGCGFQGYQSNVGGQTMTAVPATSQVDVVITRILRDDEPGSLTAFRLMSVTSLGGTDSTVPTGDLIYVKTMEVVVNGALSDPITQPTLVLDDATPNNKASLIVGFTPVTQRKDWRIPAFVDMSSTGNKQLLGGAVFADPTKQAIDTIETTCAGTPTFSIGDGTTAAKYVASSAHSAGRLRETLAANFPADSAKTGLYANVGSSSASSTAELIIVRGHRE